VCQADLPGVDLDPNETCFEAIDLTTSDKAVLTDTMNRIYRNDMSFVLEEQFTKDFDDCKTWMVTQDNRACTLNSGLCGWMTLSISKRCKVRWLQKVTSPVRIRIGFTGLLRQGPVI
jgi:hypothetical protein